MVAGLRALGGADPTQLLPDGWGTGQGRQAQILAGRLPAAYPTPSPESRTQVPKGQRHRLCGDNQALVHLSPLRVELLLPRAEGAMSCPDSELGRGPRLVGIPVLLGGPGRPSPDAAAGSPGGE